MDMTGTYRIPAPRDVVWEALNDPEVLKASIPGCEELAKVSDTELTAKVTAKVGPVKAKFSGDVRLEELNPPSSYVLKGEGKGGAAGFAKGAAKVSLAEEGDETVLTYEAHADIGGKLAQLGSRLVQGAAKKTADDFFSNFVRVVGERYAEAAPKAAAAVEQEAEAAAVPQPAEPAKPAPSAAEPAPAQPAPSAPAPAEKAFWQKPVVWLAVAAVIVVLLLLAG